MTDYVNRDELRQRLQSLQRDTLKHVRGSFSQRLVDLIFQQVYLELRNMDFAERIDFDGPRFDKVIIDEWPRGREDAAKTERFRRLYSVGPKDYVAPVNSDVDQVLTHYAKTQAVSSKFTRLWFAKFFAEDFVASLNKVREDDDVVSWANGFFVAHHHLRDEILQSMSLIDGVVAMHGSDQDVPGSKDDLP
jgi:hypothetical protein